MQEVPEIWKAVAGYEGRYDVSDLGRVRRLYGPRAASPVRVLRPRLTKRGYHRVGLGRGIDRYIHHLVAEAFIGPRPPGYTVNHKDGCKANNAADNLEYMTNAENKDHAVRLGLYARGSRSGQAKLTEDQVVEIRALYGRFDQYQLAERYGVSQQSISYLLRGRTWKHVA